MTDVNVPVSVNPSGTNAPYGETHPSWSAGTTPAEAAGTRTGQGYDPATQGYDPDVQGKPFNPSEHPGMPLTTPGLREFIEQGENPAD